MALRSVRTDGRLAWCLGERGGSGSAGVGWGGCLGNDVAYWAASGVVLIDGTFPGSRLWTQCIVGRQHMPGPFPQGGQLTLCCNVNTSDGRSGVVAGVETEVPGAHIRRVSSTRVALPSQPQLWPNGGLPRPVKPYRLVNVGKPRVPFRLQPFQPLLLIPASCGPDVRVVPGTPMKTFGTANLVMWFTEWVLVSQSA